VIGNHLKPGAFKRYGSTEFNVRLSPTLAPPTRASSSSISSGRLTRKSHTALERCKLHLKDTNFETGFSLYRLKGFETRRFQATMGINCIQLVQPHRAQLALRGGHVSLGAPSQRVRHAPGVLTPDLEYLRRLVHRRRVAAFCESNTYVALSFKGQRLNNALETEV
jgi:hypothetical protein